MIVWLDKSLYENLGIYLQCNPFNVLLQIQFKFISIPLIGYYFDVLFVFHFINSKEPQNSLDVKI